MAQVMVREAFYRGETIEGVFEMTQGYTAFTGEGRRNGRKGAGFIKVAISGDPQLTRLAPNSKPVKLTVEGEGLGYVVLGETAVMEPEFGVEGERALAEAEGLPAGVDGSPALNVGESVTVESTVDVASLLFDIQELEGLMAQQTGAERAATRKRLMRRQAKLAAL